MRSLLASLTFSLSLLFSPLGIAQPQEEQQQEQQQQQEQPTQDYVEFVKQVQIALHQHGFDPGPINGLDEGRTQAALAQFQLSRNLPASGSMDEQTLKHLGVDRAAPADENASAGAGMPIAKP